MEIRGSPEYLIYDDGRVSSKRFKSRFLKPYLRGGGYYCVKINDKNMLIHRLVAIHYIENPDNKKLVDHKDRNKLNNNKENLRWATSCENNQNVGMRKNNKLKIKNIFYRENKNRYIYSKTINKKRVLKSFKTLDEAIEYKNKI